MAFDSEALEAKLLLRRIMKFAGHHLQDPNMRAVYVTICRHNLGSTYAPGPHDRYLIDPGQVKSREELQEGN